MKTSKTQGTGEDIRQKRKRELDIRPAVMQGGRMDTETLIATDGKNTVTVSNISITPITPIEELLENWNVRKDKPIFKTILLDVTAMEDTPLNREWVRKCADEMTGPRQDVWVCGKFANE